MSFRQTLVPLTSFSLTPGNLYTHLQIQITALHTSLKQQRVRPHTAPAAAATAGAAKREDTYSLLSPDWPELYTRSRGLLYLDQSLRTPSVHAEGVSKAAVIFQSFPFQPLQYLHLPTVCVCVRPHCQSSVVVK